MSSKQTRGNGSVPVVVVYIRRAGIVLRSAVAGKQRLFKLLDTPDLTRKPALKPKRSRFKARAQTAKPLLLG